MKAVQEKKNLQIETPDYQKQLIKRESESISWQAYLAHCKEKILPLSTQQKEVTYKKYQKEWRRGQQRKSSEGSLISKQQYQNQEGKGAATLNS